MQHSVTHGGDFLRTKDLGQGVEEVPLDYLSANVINEGFQCHLDNLARC